MPALKGMAYDFLLHTFLWKLFNIKEDFINNCFMNLLQQILFVLTSFTLHTIFFLHNISCIFFNNFSVVHELWAFIMFCGISYTKTTTIRSQMKYSSSWLRGLRLTSEWEIECNCKKVRFCYTAKKRGDPS